MHHKTLARDVDAQQLLEPKHERRREQWWPQAGPADNARRKLFPARHIVGSSCVKPSAAAGPETASTYNDQHDSANYFVHEWTVRAAFLRHALNAIAQIQVEEIHREVGDANRGGRVGAVDDAG